MKPLQPCEFRRSTELDAPVARVYAFHENPHNIQKISPGWQSIQVVSAGITARTGEKFELKIRFFGLITLRWQGVWKEAQSPHRLLDEALLSPFQTWMHRHDFQPLAGERTLMTDHVTYRFAGGWLGKWFGETLGRLQFYWMFADRHRRTRRWMAEHARDGQRPDAAG